MIDHVTLHVSDIEKAKEFYGKVLEPLGYMLSMDLSEYKVAGFAASGKTDVWLSGDGVTQATHIAFSAPNKTTVDAFYDKAIEAGGRDNGKPGYRKNYTPGYYASFILDADGHNIETVFHDPAPEIDPNPPPPHEL
jgi:predicted lactoylglutathione lyase